jgi:hypothetical protein
MGNSLKITQCNTNLAGEFWVLSTLNRLGIEAQLTLGNKKSVDILVVRNSTIYTLDVKALADRYDWPADNIRVFDNPNHIYAFLTFEGKITDPKANPSVWIIPSDRLEPYIRRFATRSVVSRSLLINNGGEYQDNWKYLARQKL